MTPQISFLFTATRNLDPNCAVVLGASEHEVVQQDTDELQGQDPVERGDVDQNQAQVQLQVTSVVHIHGFWRQTSVHKAPAPPHRCSRTPVLWGPKGNEKTGFQEQTLYFLTNS